MKKTIVAVSALLISACAHAFMPASGLWNFENENVGQPGRGMMIEVQNEILFLTYFGYRADGSSVKYNSSGPITNNSYSGDLLEFKGGPVIGGPIQPAVNNGSIGTVSFNFTSGTHGTIILPGDSPRSIYKNSFGYSSGPDGLLGTWQFSEVIGSTTYGLTKTLTTKLAATTNGNGSVWTSSSDFVCEYQISGVLAGMVLCATMPSTSTTDSYLFKFNADRGAGIDYFYLNTASPIYVAANMTRIKTANGKLTGLNDETESALSIKRAVSTASTIDYSVSGKITALNDGSITQGLSEPTRDAAIGLWIAEMSKSAP